jgi:hypothetical protein
MLLFSMPVHAQWSTPVSLSPSAISATLNESMGSCLGASSDTLHVVWTDKISTTRARIYYTHSLDTGLTWSTPIALTDTSCNSWNPAIAINGKNVHVVWRELSPVNGRRASWYKRSVDGGNTWFPKVFLDSTADWPAVSVSGNNVYIANDVVTAASPYNTEIYFMRSTDNGASWSARQQLTFAVGRSEDEAIHAEGSHIHMSWNDNRVGQFQILYKESNDYGVTWGPDVVVVPVKDYNTMVWSDSAHVDVVAAGAPTGRYQLLLAQSSDTGATWNASMNLSNDTAHTYFLPDMVRNGYDLHVVCNSSGGPKYFHSGDGGTTWDSPVLLPGATFIAYTGCVLHIIYTNSADHHVYYIRNSAGNAGHCGGVITGIKNITPTDQVKVFPNPFTTETTLRISSSDKIENAELKIIDILGNEVRKITGINTNEIIVNRDKLNPGVYFFTLQAQNTIYSNGKFIIQ